MLKLTRGHYDGIVAHAGAGLPFEVCGLVAGISQGDVKQARRIYFLTNVDASAAHFSMDPREQFHVIADMRSHGYALLGNFHSHPATPARPSGEDIALAFDPALSYVIVSLMDAKPRLKSFRIEQGVAREEDVVVLDDDDEPDRET
jgi:Predicted metal-dependent protease of the PAD1/JAB1 superfamily